MVCNHVRAGAVVVVAIGATSALLFGVAPIGAAAPRPDPERASVSTYEIQGGRPTYDAMVSARGRFVVFDSMASLVPGDTNGSADVFVRDTHFGTTTRVSVDEKGHQLSDGGYLAAISPSARHILFNTGERGEMINHIHVYDRHTGQSDPVFSAYYGVRGAGGTGISANGNLIAHFYERFGVDSFVLNRATGRNRVVSRNDDGRRLHGSYPANISANGRFVPFDYYDKVYVRDRRADKTFLVSTSSRGRKASGEEPFISASGRYVVFVSRSANLVRRDHNEARDVFLRERHRQRTSIVSVNGRGRPGNGASHSPTVSANGRYVVFTSSASNLVPRDRNRAPDVFIHDTRTGRTRCISVGSDGRPAGQRSWTGYISTNGRTVAFVTRAALAPDDTNGMRDAYVVRRPSTR